MRREGRVKSDAHHGKIATNATIINCPRCRDSSKASQRMNEIQSKCASHLIPFHENHQVQYDFIPECSLDALRVLGYDVEESDLLQWCDLRDLDWEFILSTAVSINPVYSMTSTSSRCSSASYWNAKQFRRHKNLKFDKRNTGKWGPSIQIRRKEFYRDVVGIRKQFEGGHGTL